VRGGRVRTRFLGAARSFISAPCGTRVHGPWSNVVKIDDALNNLDDEVLEAPVESRTGPQALAGCAPCSSSRRRLDGR